MKRVVFLTAILTHYRLAFHERVRVILAEAGVEYRLVHGAPLAHEAAKGDTATLPWATAIPSRVVGLGGKGALWQPALAQFKGADLLVIGQENRLLLNYWLQSLPRAFRPKLAFWGHGRNFQARNRDSLAERWKRFWATRVDWWFAYTEESRRHVESLGYPAERITVFNNSVDTGELRAQAEAVSDAEALAKVRALGLLGSNTAIFVGGLYPDKRLDFLIAAADQVRASVPDFELIVVGRGLEFDKMKAYADTRPWLAVTGPLFGRDKVELMRGSKLFLMPGLVGLAILDAGVLGLPTVTTAFPHHSPEIAYLEDGVGGVIVADWQSEAAFAEAIIGLLRSPERLAAMSAGAEAAAAGYTIEAMAERFAAGALAALQ